ncbi:MAG TPA: hypothetical protein PLH72_16985 [Vicinamibacterales bacterium]|nr:hypothetical protein [Vicinamibacterales bacterium]
MSTVSLKGDRMMSVTDTAGEIVDLAEEKVYTLDLKKKTYSVVTLAEARRKMEEAMAKAKKDAEAARPEAEQKPSGEPQKEYEVDFSVKDTGRTRQIAGRDTSEKVATVVVREKGETIEDGGMVMETSMWMAPAVPELKELVDFRLRYARALYGPVMAQAAPDMTQAMAMYPMMKDAMAKFQAEGQKLSGTALATEMRFQLAAPPQEAGDRASTDDQQPAPTSVGGLLGGIGRRMARKKADEKKDDPAAKPGRTTVMTTIAETLQVGSSVASADVAVPSGFTQK